MVCICFRTVTDPLWQDLKIALHRLLFVLYKFAAVELLLGFTFAVVFVTVVKYAEFQLHLTAACYLAAFLDVPTSFLSVTDKPPLFCHKGCYTEVPIHGIGLVVLCTTRGMWAA